MGVIDLTPFGFTPTETLVYEVLLRAGPGTGYAVARAAGLARANAYQALEGLVLKGGARSDGERPKHYRPEPPSALLARIASDHGQAVERLTDGLAQLAAPPSPSLVELGSTRAVLQQLGHDIARARDRVLLAAPAEAYPLLAPSLRRPASAGATLQLVAFGPADVGVGTIEAASPPAGWPGVPLVLATDGRAAVIALRRGDEATGHWSGAPSFVAAATSLVAAFAAGTA